MDGPRLGEDLEGADEDDAVGGGGGDRCRVAEGKAAGDGEEALEAEHVVSWSGGTGRDG